MGSTAINDRPNKIWFPAKRYGWGWGLPCAWQGWVVYAAYLALLAAGFHFIPPHEDRVQFVSYVIAITGALFAVCWVKGEKPRWRWGG